MPKYAIENMLKTCEYMQKYAKGNMHKYAKYARENMLEICNYMKKYAAENIQ